MQKKSLGPSCAVLRVLLCLAVLAAGGMPRAVAAADSAAIEEIIGILRDRGLIDEEEEQRLLIKHAAERGKQSEIGSLPAALTDGFRWYAEFRLRHELLAYRHDTFGGHLDNSTRWRYRVRLGFEKDLTRNLTFALRLTSGGEPDRSVSRGTNATFGRGPDFDFDSIWINMAYVRWQLPQLGKLRTTFIGGKTPNPFVWKHGKDFLVWDRQIKPEGGALLLTYPVSEETELFSNLGYYIDDENIGGSDPKFFAGQLGGTTRLGDFEMGLRGSFYSWRSLDGDFIQRASLFGNLPTGIDGKARIGDLSAFIGTDLSEDWPLLLYGTYIRNLSADGGRCAFTPAAGGNPPSFDCSPGALGAVPVSDEDTAWGIGIELGSPRKIVKLGFGYFHLEANSVVSLFTDNMLFSGFTNRRGWSLYGARMLTDAAEFRFAMYSGNYIENAGGINGPYSISTLQADHIRLHTDVLFYF
jgi:hypothetical protein